MKDQKVERFIRDIQSLDERLQYLFVTPDLCVVRKMKSRKKIGEDFQQIVTRMSEGGSATKMEGFLQMLHNEVSNMYTTCKLKNKNDRVSQGVQGDVQTLREGEIAADADDDLGSVLHHQDEIEGKEQVSGGLCDIVQVLCNRRNTKDEEEEMLLIFSDALSAMHLDRKRKNEDIKNHLIGIIQGGIQTLRDSQNATTEDVLQAFGDIASNMLVTEQVRAQLLSDPFNYFRKHISKNGG
jgi:hypothetical protein